MNELALRQTLADVCAKRAAIIANLQTAYHAFNQADVLCHEVTKYGIHYDAKPRHDLEHAVASLDRSLWSHMFDLTGLRSFMDAQACDELSRAIERDAPEFTEETVRLTFLSKFQEADTMFVRGIVNVFRYLSDDYKRNAEEPFCVPRKCVITWTVQPSYRRGLQVRYGAENKVNDIDRVFRIVDGKTHTPRALEMSMNAAFADMLPFEDEYFKARAYRNGNLHLGFKRVDLLDKVNQLIGRYYNGNALAAARKAA